MIGLLKRAPLPPARARTRLLTVGPIPPEWGGELRGGVTRFNVTLLDEMRTASMAAPDRAARRADPASPSRPPAGRRRAIPAARSSCSRRTARPRRFTRVLLERERPDVVLLNNLAAFNGARYARVQAQVAPEMPIVAVVHEWRAIRTKEGERRERFHANGAGRPRRGRGRRLPLRAHAAAGNRGARPALPGARAR